MCCTYVSENEWWKVGGIIIAACPFHKGGDKLFEGAASSFPFRITPMLDMSKLAGISAHRFKTIKERLHFAFYDTSNTDDPWYPIVGLVDQFNCSRRKWIAASIVVVLDESMSNFQPRTTRTSLLPHLSFIFRKPKPLGTEFKVCADTETGIILYIEIQRGAGGAMKKERFFLEGLGATTACSCWIKTQRTTKVKDHTVEK